LAIAARLRLQKRDIMATIAIKIELSDMATSISTSVNA